MTASEKKGKKKKGKSCLMGDHHDQQRELKPQKATEICYKAQRVRSW